MLVHDWPRFHRDDGFRSRWAVAQSTVRAFGIVMLPPLFDQDLCLPQAVEDFSVEQFIPHSRVEAFAISVLPRRSWLDVGRLCADGRNPVPDGLGYELRAIVGANVGGNAVQDEQVCQRIDHLG